MSFTLLRATNEHKIVIAGLMQFYIYDFSEYLELDVADNGSFAPYPDLNDYWESDDVKFPYVIKEHDKYIGFALVKFISSKSRNYFSIAEFFILKRYRGKGIGRAVAISLFDLHRGQWEVFQKEQNIPAQVFWNKVISEYTKGQFTERLENGKRIQDFEN